jgi:hypothetical protein
MYSSTACTFSMGHTSHQFRSIIVLCNVSIPSIVLLPWWQVAALLPPPIGIVGIYRPYHTFEKYHSIEYH